MIRGLEEPPVFTVVDTLARSMPGGEENTSKDMGLAVFAMDSIRQAAKGGTVFTLHHVNRGQGTIRGHSSLRAALDTELKTVKKGMTATLSCEKQKDAAEFPSMVLVATDVTLPDDETSLAFVPTPSGVSALGVTQQQVLELLDEHFGDEGATFT